MKVWTLTTDQDGINVAVHYTKAAADAQAVLIVTEWFDRYLAADSEERDHTDWEETYELLGEAYNFYWTLIVEEHDISAHPAIAAARNVLAML